MTSFMFFLVRLRPLQHLLIIYIQSSLGPLLLYYFCQHSEYILLKTKFLIFFQFVQILFCTFFPTVYFIWPLNAIKFLSFQNKPLSKLHNSCNFYLHIFTWKLFGILFPPTISWHSDKASYNFLMERHLQFYSL